MSKKIVIGSFQIESNSLTAIHSERKDFSISVGEEMLDRVNCYEVFNNAGYEVVPTLYAAAVPGGAIIPEEFESILNDIIERIPLDGDFDGVWLFLHGAMDVLGKGSGDKLICKAVRKKIGPDIPIAVAFDLHADVDPEIAEYVNVICGYRTAPHIDIPETEKKAAELLIYCIENKIMPKPVIVKVPIIASGDSMTTDVYPGKELMQYLKDKEKENKSVYLNIFLGNPWVDTPCAGGAVVVIPHPDRIEDAKEQAIDLAKEFWRIRGEFKFRAKTFDVDDGTKWMLDQSNNAIFLTDTGDNVSGGGSGDNAELIKYYIENGIENVVFLGIADKPFVEKCNNLSYGEEFDGELGGTLDPASTRISVHCVFKKRGYVLSWPALKKIPSVLVSINGIDVLVNDDRTPIVHEESLNSFGIVPDNYKCLIVKLGYLWPELYDIAKDSAMLFTPGSTCEVVERCAFHDIPRPVYPIDKDMIWEPTI